MKLLSHDYNQQRHLKALQEISRKPSRFVSQSPLPFRRRLSTTAEFEVQMQNQGLLKRLLAISERKPRLPRARVSPPLRLGHRRLEAQRIREENRQLVDRLAKPQTLKLRYVPRFPGLNTQLQPLSHAPSSNHLKFVNQWSNVNGQSVL